MRFCFIMITVPQPYKTNFIQQAVVYCIIWSTVGVDDVRNRTSSIEIPRSKKEKESDITTYIYLQRENEKIT